MERLAFIALVNSTHLFLVLRYLESVRLLEMPIAIYMYMYIHGYPHPVNLFPIAGKLHAPLPPLAAHMVLLVSIPLSFHAKK